MSFTEYRDSIELFIDGKSAKEYGIQVLKTNILSSPEPRLEFHDVPGRNGSLLVTDGTYDDFILNVECVIVNETDYPMADITRKARKFFRSAINSKIQTDEDLEFYLEGTFASKLDIVETIENFGEFIAIFRCNPFRKYINNDAVTISQSGSKLYNEFEICLPYIKITGNGNITLKINDDEYSFSNVSEYIEIDSEVGNCFKDIVPMDRHFNADHLPFLYEGDNVISWVGNVSKIEIIPNKGVM